MKGIRMLGQYSNCWARLIWAIDLDNDCFVHKQTINGLPQLKSSVASTKAPSSLASSVSRRPTAHSSDIQVTAANAEILSVAHGENPWRPLAFSDVHVGKSRSIAM
ncbi:hypothetical protein SeMB42_g01456 [Synchytrium endobioticum]|uniref:Uncharacterized protein n=1 Tax=Synchytrium endobioticum TaxID=286115 RepID=A0A507CTX5_9FUNG|nr:hypothetical protein SeLEV6574_g05584 [Synchytrium endobioticum]TPX52402.1 hypothetical protein SeMB42_g01456 [Synchytrium endobioticum]